MTGVKYRRIGMDDPLYQAERELRNRFLLRPIGVADYGWEMHDRDSLHFVAVHDGEVVGCAMLRPLASSDGEAQLMQMAVDEGCRGLGVGRGLVDLLVSTAVSMGFSSVVCHSRDSAAGFYEKLGFRVFGEPFEEVGIPHSHMRLLLS